MKFVSRPVEVEATQWFRNGDHPLDNAARGPEGAIYEGHIVRYYRHPDVDGAALHSELPGADNDACDRTMHDHGWIDLGPRGYIVCPGDWIVTGVGGAYYPVHERDFERLYALVAASESASEPAAAVRSPYEKHAQIAWLRDWCVAHGVELDLEGEIGFGRECVGIVHDGEYVAWEQGCGPGREAPDSYHKADYVAVLGRGDAAVAQLFAWLRRRADEGAIVRHNVPKDVIDVGAVFWGKRTRSVLVLP